MLHRLLEYMDRRVEHASRIKKMTNTLKISLNLGLILNLILDNYAVKSMTNLRQNSVWWLLL